MSGPANEKEVAVQISSSFNALYRLLTFARCWLVAFVSSLERYILFGWNGISSGFYLGTRWLHTYMKMPERSRTSHVSQIVQSFCPKVLFLLWIERHTQIHYVMSWRHTVASLAIMISHGNSLQTKAGKSHLLTLWPWPVTYELDLQSQPS